MSSTPPAPEHAEHDQLLSIKETLVGIMIAFSMAFVFRGFIIEGFVIPTGSMAPTLLGQHYQAIGPESGYAWDVGPAARSGPRQDMSLTDPLLGTRVNVTGARRRSGDRVFVLKYLDGIHEPKRWDVPVFKNPGTRENYIKRLVGKPGEQIAFVDGDVFVREFVEGTTPRKGLEAWTGQGWDVARKNERVQRAVFQTVYDSRYTPSRTGPTYRAPFQGGPGWTGLTGEAASSSFTFAGVGNGTLTWRASKDINDWYAYNEPRFGRIDHYPVSDISVSFGVEPTGSSPVLPTVELEARGYEFRARFSGGVATLEMTATGQNRWTTLDAQPLKDNAFASGRVTAVEFWHVDQALWLFVENKLVAGGVKDGAYTLTPAQRVEHATGLPFETALARPGHNGNGITTPSGLSDVTIYLKPKLRIGFEGGPVVVHDTKIKRDLYYHINNRNKPTHGAHPNYFPTLDKNRYFMCGDNSPNSTDSRMWVLGNGSPDPWVAKEIDPRIPSIERDLLDEQQMAQLRATVGTVHRDLLIGHGFLVYFPAPTRVFGVPVPDVGRARWIW